MGNIRTILSKTWQQAKHRALFWKQLFAVTILAAYLYVFMEWIFIATMPSFMSLLSLPKKAEIFLLAGLSLALACGAVVLLIMILNAATLLTRFSRAGHYVGIAIPTVILAALALLLIDNFTYTVFKFGISTTGGIWRGAYGILFLGLLVYIYLQLLIVFGLRPRAERRIKPVNRLLFAALSLLVVSGILAWVRRDTTQITAAEATSEQQATRHPNILLLGSDGMNADFLSVYGYYRNTTPTLRELAKTSLVAENAFTNAGNTAGSIVSIMSSKLPTQTRVLYPPDILTGLNAYQHLPGLLKKEGYKSAEFGAPYYADAFSLNLQDGFDMVNNRSKSEDQLSKLGRKIGYENTAYFISKLTERISERIMHIFYIQEMENPFSLVTKPVPSMKDDEKISQILSILDQATVSKAPIFIHAHLLGTHGGYFSPKIRFFSQGVRQTNPWMPDFYADTILSFDSYLAKVINHLKQTGQYDNTILIIYTDHNEEFKVTQRIPLIIHFPHDEWAGRITAPVENMDIAPTILNYLGLPQPAWMSGESLIDDTSNDPRLIFSMGTSKYKQNEQDIYFLDPARDKPPFYQFSYVNIIDCQKWYQFELTTFEWSHGDVPNYVAPCDHLLSFDEIKQALKNRLAIDGFDISSLP